MNRRAFLATAATAQRILGANDRVRVGLIGCGGRGRYVATGMRGAVNTEFAAVCDVYETNAAKARDWAGADARQYSDFRKLLEQKDVDAVLIATPDHWHAITAVMAMGAGKHVYVEKPLAHNIREGQAIVKAAKKSKVVVQAGMQQRSAEHYREVQQIVQSGEIGEVRFVRIWNYVNYMPNGIGRAPDQDPPAGLDWDFWLGPAPKVPFNPKRFLATYRMFRDYSGGYITDYGTHRFDTMMQIMGKDSPLTVSAAGGRYTLKDLGDIPDIHQVTYEFPGFVMSYETCLTNGFGMGGRTPGQRYYNALGDFDRPNGEAYYGTQGTVVCDRVGYEVFSEPESRQSKAPRIQARRKNTTDATAIHAQHFIECIREGKPTRAPIEVGHKAAIVAHLGNISLDTGRKLKWNAEKEDFDGVPEASKLLARVPRKPWDMIR